MNNGIHRLGEPETSSAKGCLKVLALIAVVAMIASVISVWVIQKFLLPDAFKPVVLSVKEEKILNGKMEQLETMTEKHQPENGKVVLEPERYQEDPAMRTIIFSEKELNALLAKNTDLAQKLAIDLSDGMASARLLLPLDEEFPVLGGKILRVTAGLGIDFSNEKPVVVLKGVSVWGVPIPNAWLGNMKNVDFVKEFGGDTGFWKSFAEGIDKIEVKEKSLLIRLNQ
jgi:hypothetical protein